MVPDPTRRYSNPQWVRTLALCLGFVVGLSITGRVASAGCGYHPETGSEFVAGGNLVAFDQPWTVGKLVRVYSGGQFLYYQAPSGSLPCEGPSCRQRRNGPTFEHVSLVESSRNISAPFLGCQPWQPETDDERFIAWIKWTEVVDYGQELLRPPSVKMVASW